MKRRSILPSDKGGWRALVLADVLTLRVALENSHLPLASEPTLLARTEDTYSCAMPAPDDKRLVPEDPYPASEIDGEAEDGFSLQQLSQAFADAMGGQESPSDFDQPSDEAARDDERGESPGIPGHQVVDEPPAAGDQQHDQCSVTPRSILEAILFVGHPQDEAISGQAVASLLRGVEVDEVGQLVSELNEIYESSGFPYQIASIGAGYGMQLRDEFSHVRERFYGRMRQARLSQAAIDVLAVVAYNQPITCEAIDKLRGAKSGHLLAQLVRRGLLAVQSSPERPRQKQYFTTERFLAFLGLDSLDALPRSDEPD